MSTSKYSMFYINKKHLKDIKNYLNKASIDKWIFIGRNSLLCHSLESGLMVNIPRLNISKWISESQYKIRDDYIDFIEDFEYLNKDSGWWSSLLACKNPWLSNLFLRISQIDALENIIREFTDSDETIIILIEEESVYKTIRSSSFAATGNIEYFYFKEKNPPKFWLYAFGISRRVKHIILGLKQKWLYNRIFKKQYFNYSLKKYDNLVIVPTFLDGRNFRSGEYRDPFMGKAIEYFSLNKIKIVIVPIVIAVSKNELKLFNDWLNKNNIYIHPLYKLFNINNALLYTIKNIKIKSFKKHFYTFQNRNVDKLLIDEYLVDWKKFNYIEYLIKEFAHTLNNQNGKIIVAYPFENQAWERILISELSKRKGTFFIGIQNAPCPSLSTRFFVSKKYIREIPLPNCIIANGTISYNQLKNTYADVLKVYKARSSRPIFEKGVSTKKENDQVMVACSIGASESVELITFIVNTFIRYNLNNNVYIVTHPLAKYNYSSLLNKLNCPPNIMISKRTYNEEMNSAKFIIFDSSTAGLEGMINGVIPIYVGHECSVHVNPLEYDQTITRKVYNSEELNNALRETGHRGNKEINNSIGSQYFGDDSTPEIISVLDGIVHHVFLAN